MNGRGVLLKPTKTMNSELNKKQNQVINLFALKINCGSEYKQDLVLKFLN